MENESVIKICFEKKKSLEIDNFTFISIYDYRLTENELEKTRRKLDETEDRRRKCLRELKERLGKDEKVKYRTDDDYLLRYLRHCKFDCVKAHKVMLNFYTIRMKYAEYFTIPPDLKTLFNRGFLTYLPYTDEEGNLIFWINYRNWNLDEISITQLIQMVFIFADIITMNPKCQINGCIGVWDLRGFSLQHMAQILHPSILWLFANVLQDCYPWKLKYIIGIHSNKFVRAFYSAVRLVLKKKIADRIKPIGSDMNELHQYVNPVLLPKEYGGSLEENECCATDFTENILQNLKYLQFERTFGFKTES